MQKKLPSKLKIFLKKEHLGSVYFAPTGEYILIEQRFSLLGSGLSKNGENSSHEAEDKFDFHGARARPKEQVNIQRIVNSIN